MIFMVSFPREARPSSVRLQRHRTLEESIAEPAGPSLRGQETYFGGPDLS